ncbi:MAG: asparagine synthase (glutamine-hydrolyzing) [Burkholderiales bacterium]|nr:asparagine synthase (glutamine-hydrolyzing) [Burkholderiales bacterium]
MCGIAGHFGRPRGPGLRARMRTALSRRGPDAQHDAAFDRSGRRLPDQAQAEVGLVHTRLAIIDPRPIADQPMGSDDGAVWIAYNGEVYGWQAAARELEARGVAFETSSDTEFILRGYEAWGIEALLARLRGMFAFAIVDFRTRRVHVVRDRLGLKPIVYAHAADGFAFGSLVRSVLPWLPPEQRGFSSDAIDAYLAHRYVPAPRTIFDHVARLPNGHRLEYDLQANRLDVHRWWSPQAEPAADPGALLDEAIELRLVADRPLGLFLSGGIDSGTIACRLAATGHRQLRSFSAAFPGSALDESADAAATARALGLPNERIVVPTTIRDDFEEIIATLDEPFADPSSFPTWYLARATERHVKVVLGGDGGDELFAGYKRVTKHLRNAWRAGLTLPLPVLPDVASKGWRKASGELAVDWETAYALRFSGLTPNQRRFLQPGRAACPTHYWRTPELAADNRVDRLLRWDFANYLPEYVLRKADLATMAHGLELRAPLLDHRFVGAVLALPAGVRFTKPPKMYLARLAPELQRLGAFERKKRGFNPPLDGWLKDDLRERLGAAAGALHDLTNGQVDAQRARAMVDAYAHRSGLAEQVLSLVILAESLRQLRALASDLG